MKLKEFMIQSPTGKTHAINPKTGKTYCGNPQLTATPEVSIHTLEDRGWRFLDVVPSDEHEPTCYTCKLRYDDPLRREICNISKDLKTQISDFLCSCLVLKDVKALGRFTVTIAQFVRNEVKLRKAEKAKVK